MIAIETALVARLKADAGVSAIVGTRVYPMVLAQGAALPAVVYQRISAPQTHVLGGPAILTRPRVQLSLWAAAYGAAKALRDAAVAALDGYRAPDGSWVAQTDTDHDDYDAETGRYRVILDVMIVHS